MGIEIIPEGERMPAVQPAKLRCAAFPRGTLHQKDFFLRRFIQRGCFHAVKLAVEVLGSKCFVL
jgi:hypothetical protein